ncbi:MAG TPA: sn-glycerol-3-phosphate ABC transporter ATP-binding protein UgpC [Gemmatimonadaceae bacterium]|nr:sn-glycerol-3-phosphate ABC transporter ATP-binding protein UgpC [Gemmatimonadaceae bacterium]
MAKISLQNVSKRYADGTLVVKDFNLDIADGEFVVLVGPSGCGKSTLLNMLAGLEPVTDGTIAIDEDVVNDVPARQRNIAMVFQSYALYPHMSVRENMAFPLELAGLSAAEIRERVERVADMLELTPHLDRRPAGLSGGQRQRVAMGRAIVRRPRAFLMDEPLSNLDARLRVQMRRQIASIQRRIGTTTIYVTHDQTEAMTLGDRVVVMRRGVVQQVGPPQSLYDAPANLFVAGFMGSPSMNFLPGRAPGEPRDVMLGIRPEHLRSAGDSEARAGSRDEHDLDVVVDAVESLGSDTYAYFPMPGADRPFIARLDPSSPVRQGDTVRLRYAARHVHVFDRATGARLRHAVPPKLQEHNSRDDQRATEQRAE